MFEHHNSINVFRILLLHVVLLTNQNVFAEQIQIKILDPQSQPLSNIVVYLHAEGELSSEQSHISNVSLQDKPAIMDQIDKQFMPHILVVQKSSWVDFPNSDSIKHHVYSFSPTQSFELKLYSAGEPNTLQFDSVGEVSMGCNIHDWMLGYIYVVDTPWFGKTSHQGTVSFDIPKGNYTLKIWSPLLQDADKDLSISLDTNTAKQTTVMLNQPLLPSLVDYEESDELDDY